MMAPDIQALVEHAVLLFFFASYPLLAGFKSCQPKFQLYLILLTELIGQLSWITKQ